jgi:TolB-like protein/Tfp pilus assembly protein PilF
VSDGGGKAGISSGKRLNSWKEIAAYLEKDVRTVQRWEKNEGLPVHRKPHDKLSSVYAYQSELDAWWNQGSHPAPPLVTIRVSARNARPALVVLPLRNLSGNPEQDYFSDGITEELITQIGRLDPAQLGVIARASAMKYKQTRKGIGQIAHELAVDYALEGSIRREGDRVRISVALVRTADETSLWSDVYDRDLRDILKLQIEVAETVAKEIAVKVSDGERDRLARASRVDPEAYSVYLRGRYLWNRRTPDALQRAIRCFEEAIAQDQAYAPAYAGLADCYGLLTSIHIGVVPPNDGMPKAVSAANRALQIDPMLAEAHTSLGHARLWYEWNWPAAEQSFRRALDLNPAYAPARQWYSAYLQTIDRSDEALQELGRALELDPLSLVIRTALQATLYLERQYEKAVDESKKTLELDSTFVLTYFNLGRAHTQMKMHRQAVAELKRAYELSEQSPPMIMQLGYAYAMAGKKAEAEKMLAALGRLARKRYVPSFYAAAIYAGLRDEENALEWLRKAHDERCDYLVHLPKEPAADPIREAPGFAQLVPKPSRCDLMNFDDQAR